MEMFHTYEEMLKKGMEKLPERASTHKRFKIPSVVTEQQGNKTLVKNFGEIVNVLRRDAKHLSKFLFNQLATPGSIRGSGQNSVLVLQRRVATQLIQKKLEDYVRDFVYCKECRKPDTRLVKEGRMLYMVCEACGAKRVVSG